MGGIMSFIQALAAFSVEFIAWGIVLGLFVLVGWAIGYRQGYVVGREDAAALARKNRERA